MRYSRETWSIDLPEGWEVEETDECIIVFHPDKLGAFQVSSYYKEEGVVSREDLITFAETEDVADVELPHLKGLTQTLPADEDGFILTQWWLSWQSELIFVTYACEESHIEAESADRDALINSLQPIVQ